MNSINVNKRQGKRASGTPESTTEGSNRVSGTPESITEGSNRVSGTPESITEESNRVSGTPESITEESAGVRNKLGEGKVSKKTYPVNSIQFLSLI
jgi:LysM repeat protein